MFDARAALEHLGREGLSLQPQGRDRLEVTSPAPLTDAQRAWIKRHKYALLWQLARREGGGGR